MSGPDVDALVADVRDSIRPRGPFLGEDRLRQSERDRVDESLAALDSLAALARSAVETKEALRWYAEQPDNYMRAEAALQGKTLAEYREALAAARSREQQDGDEWFVPEGDQRCGVIHTEAHATCMARKGHDGPHRNTQGTWIDGPWCEYPSREQQEGT